MDLGCSRGKLAVQWKRRGSPWTLLAWTQW